MIQHLLFPKKWLVLVLSFMLNPAVAAPPQHPQQGPTAQIDSGTIEGIIIDGVLSFKGVPYAAPPVGDLRWRAPQPAAPWTDVKKTLTYGADCMQKPDVNEAAPPGNSPAEDCLFINVWRPAEVPVGETRPVLVWIHGGGFVNGGSSAAIYDGSSFAKKGLVFVSFNYRLGRFGFFAHPALTTAKEGPLGNYGIMDQIAALQWVQKNIAAFQGNPAQVTVMGESSGGISVLTLMTSQNDKQLFHKAIIMSGGGRGWLVGGKQMSTGDLSAEQTGVNFASTVGIEGTGPEALTALRALTAEQVTGDLNMTSYLLDPDQRLIYAGGPIVDNEIVKGAPGDLLKAGTVTKIPIVIGTTGRDLSLEFKPTKEALFATFGEDADEARTLYDPDGTKTLRDLNQDVGADRAMNEPARFVAEQMTAQGNKAWIYRFYYVAETKRSDWEGANHATDLPYAFNNLKARYLNNVTDKDQATANAVHGYFANFAKGDSPNSTEMPAWSEFSTDISNLLRFTLDEGTVFGADPWKDRLDLVEKQAETNPTPTPTPPPTPPETPPANPAQ
ncbi:carboxylesterase family protein [Bdellovibrio sp. 22V]|uniref:carboxylesterase/lipase family protein n=1 Tax=Bdellovibrio sp. 22V TaxID=3044166 RepID=UPI002543E658|nr:carboxylesterase family protein [Bdellovibrio sp. 22V]WII71997.1 carboxylesterase family protein [Bdellovibrio sp. 22V]